MVLPCLIVISIKFLKHQLKFWFVWFKYIFLCLHLLCCHFCLIRNPANIAGWNEISDVSAMNYLMEPLDCSGTFLVLEAFWLSYRLCRTKFLVSASIRNEWRSCWSSKQQFPSPKRKPERSVCHWCHRQQTTLQTGNKAARVFTAKHRGPYLFKPHTRCVCPCFHQHCVLIVPTSDSLSGLSHIWLPCIAISIHLTSPPAG